MNLWDYNSNKIITYFKDLNSLLNYINNHEIQKFHIVNKYGLEYDMKLTNITTNNNDEIIYFDNNHISYVDSLNNLCISDSFFKKYKDDIINEVINVLYNNKKVYISEYVYSDSLIKNLMLFADEITFSKKIIIPIEIKELLNYNCVKYYQDDKKESSSNKVLGLDYEIITSKSSDLILGISIEDIENLRLIPSYKKIIITNDNKDKDYDYDKLYKIIDFLRKNNQNNTIIINIENRNSFFKSKLYSSSFSNVFININYEFYKLEDFKEECKILNLMVKDIINSSYSPFEKYIAVYNIVKKFKKYKENEEELSDSRKISKLLNNEYMVCVGYSVLLKELLNWIGISSYEYNVLVDTSYDNGFTLEDKKTNFDGHERLIVKLDDSKYNIKGFYVSDPTWDNNLKNDYYNHALISFDKTGKENRYFYLTDEELLMNVKSFDEFQNNLNYILDKKLKYYKDDKNNLSFVYENLVYNLINIIKQLDYNFYKQIKEKYLNIIDFDDKYINIDMVNLFFTEIGYYFVNNNGKDVSIETIIDAACNVNKDVFSFSKEELESYKEKLLDKNIEIDKVAFPYYYHEKYIK